MALEDQYHVTRIAPRDLPSSRTIGLVAYRQQKSLRPGYSADTEQGSSGYTSASSSIFNASKASTNSEEGGLRLCFKNQLDNMLDSRLTTNMAMFIPLDRPFRAERASWLAHNTDVGTQRLPRPQKSLQLLCEMHSPLESNTAPTQMLQILSQSPKLGDIGEWQPRKTVSLNDLGDSSREHKWPGSIVSLASPLAPKYPPPQRAPTPPGLPSFGTREAVSYSAQFLGNSVTGHTNEQCLREPRTRVCGSDSSRKRPFREILKRLFGFSTSSGTRHNRPLVEAVGRAADGTAVQGRFPYRQSGHGTNVGRQLRDHPFHQGSVSDVIRGPSNTDRSPTTQNGPSTYTEKGYSAVDSTQPYTDLQLDSTIRPFTCTSTSQVLLPSIPSRAVAVHPELSSRASISVLPERLPHHNRTGQSSSRAAAIVHCDSTALNINVTDGPSDPRSMHSQLPLAEAMRVRTGEVEESASTEELYGFRPIITTYCFCCYSCGRNTRFPLQ